MDVKYIPSDWEKMKDGIGDLIGLGRWGKGMIDELKDLSDILEEAEEDIAKYDVDGAITFEHSDQKSKYQDLFEDFKVLHDFSGKVGEIVDRTIDQPFYEDMDAFVEAMRDLSISNYKTTNRMGVTEIVHSYAGYGAPQQFEIEKAEVSLDDLFSGDNYYGEQMKLEYEEWKRVNPDQDFSQEEYQQAIVNTRAFEYESIHNQQENKEFWFQIGALVVTIGATIICPPAGIALATAYGAYELTSAVSGKDLISGRELGTSERWVRGLLAPLDIVPGVSGLTKFSGAVRLANASDGIGSMALKSGARGSFQQSITPVNDMVVEAGKSGSARLRSAGAVIQDGAVMMKNKVITDTIEAAKLADRAVTGMKNTFQVPQEGLALAGMGPVGRTREVFENTHTIESKVRDVVNRIEGVNLGNGIKGIENVKQGDKSSLAPGGGLAAHELKGGHLIERHVGKTDEQLLERLKTNPKITGSSTFKDRMAAEKVASTVLSDPENIEKIQKWLSNPNSRPTLPLKYNGDGEIIGRSVSRNSEVVENVTNAKIILKKDNSGGFILTGYPVK